MGLRRRSLESCYLKRVGLQFQILRDGHWENLANGILPVSSFFYRTGGTLCVGDQRTPAPEGTNACCPHYRFSHGPPRGLATYRPYSVISPSTATATYLCVTTSRNCTT